MSPVHPFSLMAKPVGAVCNLDCRYCYYLEKERLYPSRDPFRMRPEVLETYIRQYIESQSGPEVTFLWQGGEPTLLGIDFFRMAVALQKKYAGGKRIANALQTNGTLLDEAWCTFFNEHGFLIGISVDGPRALHDAYRRDKRGQPTFDLVMRGLECLQRNKIPYNTLTVVHRQNSREPQAVYRFLTSLGSTYLQFIPLVERKASPASRAAGYALEPPLPAGAAAVDPPVTRWSVRAEDYGTFLIDIFDHWVRRDVGRVFVQLFEVALGNHLRLGSTMCVFAETCGQALVIEHNGDIFACDHYVYPAYRLGNVMANPLAELAGSTFQRQFGEAKRDTLPAFCRSCPVRHLCQGECPKHRFVRTPDGEPGLNYLCAGYRRFFQHITPNLELMAECLRQRRPASDVMSLLHTRP